MGRYATTAGARASAAFGALAVGLLAMPAAMAQQAAPADAKDANIQEIVVTAQKSSQAISKIGAAITAFNGDQLKEAGVVSVSALQNITPGLEIGWASRGVSISIRGVTTTDVTSKGQADIVYAIDDIPVARPQLMGLAFFDTSRIEVLRGPQGTLYGLSATGGVVNVITNKPTDKLEASADAEIGNYNTRRFNGMVNIPVAENFAIRAAATSNYREGFIKPDLVDPNLASSVQVPGSNAYQDGEDNWAGRITAKYDFGNNGSFVLTSTFGHIGGNNETGTVLYNNLLAGGSQRFNVYANPEAENLGLNDKFLNFNAGLNFDVGGVHVSYNGAHDWWHGIDDNNVSVNDPFTYTTQPAFSGCATATYGSNACAGTFNWEQYDSHDVVDSHEIRLSNADPHARLEWQVGANYFHEHNQENDVEWATSANPSDVTLTSLGYPTGTTGSVNCVAQPMFAGCSVPNPQIVGPTIHRSVGVFGQGSYHITDKLKLTLGLRYSWDLSARYDVFAAGGASTVNGYSAWLNTQGTPCGPINGSCLNAAQVSPDAGVNNTKALTYHVGLDYQITPADLVYAAVSSGYKGGGFNDLDPTASTRQVGLYGAEHVTAYEAGFKGRITPTLSVTSDAYYYDYSDYQLTGATFMSQLASGAIGVVIYTTTHPATMYGWENSINWRATDHDQFNVSFELEKAFWNHGDNAATAGFLYQLPRPVAGWSLDRVPGHAGTVSYEHRFDLASGGNIKFHVSSKLSGGYWLNDYAGEGSPFPPNYTLEPKEYRQGAYSRTDLTLGYTSPDGKFGLEAYVRNLENKVQMQSAPAVTGGYQTVSINTPRFFGARVSVKY
jgi:iron complex outermembrane recepter protein